MDVDEIQSYDIRSDVLERFNFTHAWEITARLNNIPMDDLFYRALEEIVRFRVIDVKGNKKKGIEHQYADVVMIPGHQWGGAYGPVKSDVMIVGRRPGHDDVHKGRHMSGDSGLELLRSFRSRDMDVNNFYLSNVVRFMPPDGGKKLKPGHVKDCAPLLQYELEVVRPRYLLLLGSEPMKFVFGRKATLKGLRGAEIPYSIDNLGKMPEAVMLDLIESRAVITIDPYQVIRDPSMSSGFEEDIDKLCHMIRPKTSVTVPKTKLNYHYILQLDALKKLVDELLAAGVEKLAIDCEWGGEDYRSGTLRTIQFCWAPGEAAAVVLRKEGGDWVFDSEQLLIVKELRRLFDRPEAKIIGHNFRADAPWLEDIGVSVMKNLWFDTMLADHMLDESAEHTLVPGLAGRYTDMGRYDFELELWKKKYPAKVKGSLGYINVPDELLLPYGVADADCTFRAHEKLMHLLRLPENANLCRLLVRAIMPANQPIYEMETTGIFVDSDRMVDLLWRYSERKNELLAELRDALHNNTFNPRSAPQKVTMLFGPPEEGGLGLTPIKTTEKPPREWARVLQLTDRERARVRPAVDIEVLELLLGEVTDEKTRHIVDTLYKFQVIDQVTKNFLKMPKGFEDSDPEDSDVQFSREVYVDGLLGHVDDDGRIRTRISQTKETGRYGSSNPNLQNISKKQESKYAEIMGDIPSLRSCFMASEGHVLIEADYKSAEILGLAMISGDKNLIEDALGPVKLHAKVAVDVLGAPCSYQEVANEYQDLYVSAKNINFGIPYQRGPRAIARQINRENKDKPDAVNITAAETKQYVSDWYIRYPMVSEYIDHVKELVRESPHYIENAYGRRRRFHYSDDESIMAAQEREAINFPIQSVVAETLSRALYNLWDYKRVNTWCDFRILLAIHDAVILEVPVGLIEHVVEFVLPKCMVGGAMVPARTSDSMLGPKKGFSFDIDPDIYLRWGEKPTAEDLKDIGVPEKYWPKKK